MSEDSNNDEIKPWGPTEDGENFDILITHLEKVIKDGTATNIGVMGPYGSGKSSFIETFLNKKDRTHSVIRVSLANFNDKEDDDNLNHPNTRVKITTETSDTSQNINTEIKDKAIIDDTTLQIGIVQQILYHFNPKQIPSSRFKRIDSPNKITFVTLFLPLIIIIFYIAFQTNIISQIIPQFIFLNPLYCTIKIYNCIHLILFILSIPSITYISWVIYKTIINWRTISITTPIGSVDLEKSTTNILDKYLEEILYVFDANSQKNIVIFEDMDRFKEPIAILTKLREINHLLNNRGKEPIIFIYAIREDLIPKPEDRVKFFNFIIPIIPYSDQNNSENRLIKIFPKEIYPVEENLLMILSDYLYDTRLMQHIYNEYKFYFNILKKEGFAEFNPNKLLAMIAYKNLYPYDFEDLRQKKGYLYYGTRIGINSSIGDFKTNITSLPNSEEEHGFKTIIRRDVPVPENRPKADSIQLDFIYSLLSKEYISDDYEDYMSHFIPGSISATDRQFVQKVRALSVNKKQWEQDLDKVENIIKKLSLYYFTSPSILNYDLFFWLISSLSWSEENINFENLDLSPYGFQFQKMLSILEEKDSNDNVIQQEFINGLLGPNGVQKYPNQEDILYKLIRTYKIISTQDLKFSDIPENTPFELVNLIYEGQYYIPSIEILTKCYNLLPKTVTDMYNYYYHVQKCIAETQIPAEDLNTALDNIVSTINTLIPEIDISPQDEEKIKFIKQILLNPKLQNSQEFLDVLKSKNIPLEFNDSHIEQLKNLPFDRIKLLIENVMIVVTLFTSISTDNKTLSENEKIMLWNIYIKKNKELVQNELTPPVLHTIFPRWEILKKGGPFKINDTPNNQSFCQFLKKNKSIGTYYPIKGKLIQVNRTRSKE